MSTAGAVAQLARVVTQLAERRREYEELKHLVTQFEQSGLYAVIGERELVDRLGQQLTDATGRVEGLAGDGTGGPDPSHQLAEIAKLLSGARWLHAAEVRTALQSRLAELDRRAGELGAWLGQCTTQIDALDRQLRRAGVDGVQRKALREELDALDRLHQQVASADEAMNAGRLSVALAIRERMEPKPGAPQAAAVAPVIDATPPEPTLLDLPRLTADVDEKAAAAREMTRLAEVLLLRGVQNQGMREYTFVLRTPSAPGTHGVSIHDVVEVVEKDHARAERGVAGATRAVARSRDMSAATKEPVATDRPLLDELVDLGDFLYRVFLPPFAQRILAESTCPVSITTNDVALPWELLHDGEAFMCLQRPLARMPTGQAIPRRLRRRPVQRRLKFLLTHANPHQDLPEVEAEVKHVKDELEKAWSGQIEIDEEPRPTGSFLNDVLRHGRYDVVHFAGHADFEEGSDGERARAGLVLFGEDDSPTEMFPASKIQRFVEGSPIVFLNACSTGKSESETSTEVAYDAKPAAGLSSAFVYGGALACIGSLWPVYDASARFFAVEFYNAIIDRDSIGGAMLAARQATFQKFKDDATWASFVLFGNPTFRLDTSVEAAAGATRL